MFGFWGHWCGNIELEGVGIPISGKRRLGTYLRGYSSRVPLPAYIANYDMNEDGPPDTVNGITTMATGYPNFHTIAGLTPYVYKLVGQGSFHHAEWNTSDPLDPPRHTKLPVHRPDLILGFMGTAYYNNHGKTTTGNSVQGQVGIDFKQFPYLKFLSFYEGYASGFDYPYLPDHLEVFVITEMPLLSNLPVMPKTLTFFAINECNTLTTTDVLNALVDAENLETFVAINNAPFPSLIANVQLLVGHVDLSTKHKLKRIQLSGSRLNAEERTTQISISPTALASGFYIWQTYYTELDPAIHASAWDSILSTCEAFILYSNSLANAEFIWNRSFADTDISFNCAYFIIPGSRVSGNIMLSNSRPNILLFYTGDTQYGFSYANNNHPTIDIRGLINAQTIDVSNCGVQLLSLPENNTNITLLDVRNNVLDITTSPDLKTRITEMANLSLLRLSTQSSDNGFGTDFDLSGLSKLSELNAININISGTITLPDANGLMTRVFVSNNPGLNFVANLEAHGLTLTHLYVGNTNVAPDFSLLTKLSAIITEGNTGIVTIDLSTRDTIVGIALLTLQDMPNVTAIVFPATATTAIISGSGITMYNNPSLQTITNLENVSFIKTNATQRIFDCYNNSVLNIAFPFGTNDFRPGTIRIQNNALSLENVDLTINSIYNNRAADWGDGAKSLNISGSNAAPSGTYQSPTGFVQGTDDGSPASAKEQAYVLANNYGWTITMN